MVVLRFISKNNCYHKYWLCGCDCNKKKIIREDSLRSGNTQSCGCFQQDRTSHVNTTHGHTRNEKISETYQSWFSMIQRCTNPKHKYYKNYGGRSIKVCKRWMEFENFLEDMGERPGKRYSIDRINNNKGYCKSNCCWATKKQQSRNSRYNHLETYNGKAQCIAAWAEELGFNPGTLLYRLKHNWSIEKALTSPVQKRRK